MASSFCPSILTQKMDEQGNFYGKSLNVGVILFRSFGAKFGWVSDVNKWEFAPFASHKIGVLHR